MIQNINNRWQAFAAHFGISLAIFIALLALIVFYWYPGQFIELGGWQGIQIVAGVDLVLGPMLTLIVFNRAKKSLKWDLSIIAAIQFGCLSYGVHAIDQQRPVAQVLLDEVLYVVSKSDLEPEGLKKLSSFEGSYPKYVVIDLPNDHTTLATTLVSEMLKGTPLHTQPSKYLDARSTEKKATSKLKWELNRIDGYETDIPELQVELSSPHKVGQIKITPKYGA